MHDWKNWTWKIRWQNEWEKNKWLKELKFITIPKAFWHFVKISNNLQVISFLYCCSIILVPIFPPLLSPALPTPHPPTFNPSLQVVCPRVLYACSLTILLLLSPIIPFPQPSGYCQFVLYFHVSGSILLAFFFCWLGSTFRWDHMVFVFHCVTYFTYHNALQFHPCCLLGEEFLLSFHCIVFHCVNVPQFFDPLIYWWTLMLFPALWLL